MCIKQCFVLLLRKRFIVVMTRRGSVSFLLSFLSLFLSVSILLQRYSEDNKFTVKLRQDKWILLVEITIWIVRLPFRGSVRSVGRRKGVISGFLASTFTYSRILRTTSYSTDVWINLWGKNNVLALYMAETNAHGVSRCSKILLWLKAWNRNIRSQCNKI